MTRESEQSSINYVSQPALLPGHLTEVELGHEACPGWLFKFALTSKGDIRLFTMETTRDYMERHWEPDEGEDFEVMYPYPAHPTARFFRALPIGELTSFAVQTVRQTADQMLQWINAGKSSRFEDIQSQTLDILNTFPENQRPGRAGRPDIFYATLAMRYVEKLGSNTEVRDLADELFISSSQIRNLLYESRRRKLLTKPAHAGRAGGELTPKAIRILEEGDTYAKH